MTTQTFSADSAHQFLAKHQREQFRHFDEFFRLVAGEPASYFPDFESVRRTVVGRAEQVKASRADIDRKHQELVTFYEGPVDTAFRAAKELGGIKFVLGGGARFGPPQVKAVRKLALYADTILIPDPVLPWLEADRSEEKFGHVLELRDLFHALQFRPLIDAELPYPAIVFIPSFEKTLERADQYTREQQSLLVTSVLSYHSGETFASLEDVFKFAERFPDRFLELVEQKGLFVPPGHEGGPIAIKDALRSYREYLATWRPAIHDGLEHVSDARLLAVGLIERLAPQYHLLENCEELSAHPLLSMSVHWTYFDLCRTAFAGQLAAAGLLQPEWKAEERLLQDPALAWLGNVPFDELARLRRDNENEAFRKHLAQMASELHGTPLSGLAKAVPEIIRGLTGLLAEHQKRVREIEDDYQRRHSKTAAISLITGAVTIAPVLAPIVGIVPGVAATLLIAAKYASDKLDERSELRKLSRSLLGVLSDARAGRDHMQGETHAD